MLIARPVQQYPHQSPSPLFHSSSSRYLCALACCKLVSSSPALPHLIRSRLPLAILIFHIMSELKHPRGRTTLARSISRYDLFQLDFQQDSISATPRNYLRVSWAKTALRIKHIFLGTAIAVIARCSPVPLIPGSGPVWTQRSWLFLSFCTAMMMAAIAAQAQRTQWLHT